MAGESSTVLQDWELLHNSAPVNSPDSVADFQGIEAESEGMIRSDYFSLDNHTRLVADDLSEEEEASVQSDNPSWIDPGTETETSYQIKNSGEFWSDSGSDRSDDRKVSDFDVKNDMGLKGIGEIEAKSGKGLKFSEFDAKNELGFVENEKRNLGFEGFGGIHVEGKDLGKFWSYSDGDGMVSIKFTDVGNESGLAFTDNLKEDDESNISNETDEQIDSVMAEEGQSSGTENAVVQEIQPKGQSNGEVNRVMWWKVPIDIMKYCLFKVSPVWSFSVAAAVMGIVILGRRLYKMKRKTRGLELKLAVDDKKVSQFMNGVARFNEAFAVGRRIPIVRPPLPAAGLNPWPVMSLR